jgi:hypothetical protein
MAQNYEKTREVQKKRKKIQSSSLFYCQNKRTFAQLLQE